MKFETSDPTSRVLKYRAILTKSTLDLADIDQVLLVQQTTSRPVHSRCHINTEKGDFVITCLYHINPFSFLSKP